MTRISVIGLGAMGASYTARLQDAPGNKVRVIASGERAARLRRDGVTVNGRRYDFDVVDPGEVVEPAELMLVGVKYTGFHLALEQMRHHIGPGTVVISLINGITSEAEIARAYPQCHPLLSITFGVDAVRRGQTITYEHLGKIAFGEPANVPPYSVQVRFVAQVCEDAGLTYDIPPDMVHDMWWKFMINVGVNQVTAVLGAPYGSVQDPASPAYELMLAAQREVVAVAQARGVSLTDADIGAWLEVLAGLAPDGYTSMSQDILARRPTEADIFSGSMRSMGAKAGIPVPVNTCLHQILKSLERRETSDHLS